MTWDQVVALTLALAIITLGLIALDARVTTLEDRLNGVVVMEKETTNAP